MYFFNFQIDRICVQVSRGFVKGCIFFKVAVYLLIVRRWLNVIFHRLYSKKFFFNWRCLLKNFISYRKKKYHGYGVIETTSWVISVEGRVELQKVNQTAPYAFSCASLVTFFPVNQVEHQKLNHAADYLVEFFIFTRPLADAAH